MAQAAHSQKISVAKAIGICLMVVGHTACPKLLYDWLYSFHMPLFFFMSGYLFRPSRLANPAEFFKRKIRGLYLPYVGWTLLFILFHNTLYELELQEESYSLAEALRHTADALTMRGTEQLTGGFWFIKILFESSVVCFALMYIFRPIFSETADKRARRVALAAMSAMMLLAAVMLSMGAFRSELTLICLSSAFFAAGELIGRWQLSPTMPAAVGMLFTTVCFTAVYGHPMTVATEGWLLVAHYLFAVTCIMAVLGVAEGLAKSKIGAALDYIGSSTLTILALHFMSFKLVSLYIVKRDGLPMERLSEFPTIVGAEASDWLLYAAVGIVLPLMLRTLRDVCVRAFRRARLPRLTSEGSEG